MLTDVEKIAPCLPGIWLQQVEGDEYQGVVKVKVGPVTTSYEGVARFLLLDANTPQGCAQGGRPRDPRTRKGHCRLSPRPSPPQVKAPGSKSSPLFPSRAGWLTWPTV